MKRMRNVSRVVQDAAREHRSAPTMAERIVWEGLRQERLDGLRFRRQYPIDRFILDFYCPELKLCVEVDGAIHDDQRERDAERTARLEMQGITVLRIRNEEVDANPATAFDRIRAEAHRLRQTP